MTNGVGVWQSVAVGNDGEPKSLPVFPLVIETWSLVIPRICS